MQSELPSVIAAMSSVETKRPLLAWWVLGTWVIFVLTLIPDYRVRVVVSLEGRDDLIALWIVAAVLGVAAGVLAFRNWAKWWALFSIAAGLLILASALYWYDALLSLQAGTKDASFATAMHDLWKTAWHTVRAGAVLLLYREMLMPLIQLATLGYVLWLRTFRASTA